MESRLRIRLDDQEIEYQPGESLQGVFKQNLSGKKFKRVVAAKCGSSLMDLDQPVPEGCTEINPVYLDSEQGRDILRHSTAHVMAEAVKSLFPSARFGIGPSIEDGFYYDFHCEHTFTPEDLTAIENKMQEIIDSDLPFQRRVVSLQEAREIFSGKNEDLKLELLEEMQEQEVSIYSQGEFLDLCSGPHLPSTGMIKAFKLTSVAGAYWRGDENNIMLQRIYGTAWPTDKELKEHLKKLEEAARRDHRKLGRELDLFSFSDEAGPGMPIFHPRGALIRTILEDFETKEHLKRGYEIVRGPRLLRKELWEKSGHYQNYGHNMYFSQIEDQVYGIKPMNCVSHMLIYNSDLRSYRDLPKRYFELGTVNRHEKSGVMHGLMRVRQFTQDDAHIFCRQDQLQEEITSIVRFVQDVMRLFGFEYEVEISTRPEKSIGTEEAWEKSTQALMDALESLGLEYGICPGDGAFYGPKIDVKLKDALNRKWQCATIQCDFTLPEKFDLSYIREDGQKHRPVMIHRVILGAVERFFGVLIEHFAGAMPTWLAPEQARILTITDDHIPFADECLNYLRSHGIRADKDLRNEKLGYKVRQAQLMKIPYVLVIGDNEVQAEQVNVRLLGGNNLGAMDLDQVRQTIIEDSLQPFKNGGMYYNFGY
ncbi:MAG: threonine--tRNA ligase [Thermodesulfobacteriota bacterium]